MTAAARVLEDRVLVLNKGWNAIRVATVKEAIGLVAKGSARIIDPKDFAQLDLMSWADVSKARAKYGDAVIRSQRLVLLPPEVVVLTEYDGIAERSVVFSRRNLFKRDKYTCMYCGAQPGPEELTIDHVLPKSRGGVSSWENCALACMPCNKRKANRTPDEAGMKLRRQPRRPSWRTLIHVSPRERRQSWEQFLSKAYWEVELEP